MSGQKAPSNPDLKKSFLDASSAEAAKKKLDALEPGHKGGVSGGSAEKLYTRAESVFGGLRKQAKKTLSDVGLASENLASVEDPSSVSLVDKLQGKLFSKAEGKQAEALAQQIESRKSLILTRRAAPGRSGRMYAENS
jgi:hypothetical protein